MAASLRSDFEAQQGVIAAMSSDDRNAALDLIEEQAVASDGFVALVSEILDELRSKFELVTVGALREDDDRLAESMALRHDRRRTVPFPRSGPLVLRNLVPILGKATDSAGHGHSRHVKGPLKPAWAPKHTRLVLVDTEGLGHKANSTADLPDQTLRLLHEADLILLVDSAKNGLTNFLAGKALEAVVNGGHTRKLCMVFTHMDSVRGENLRGQAKLDHVFGGVRNVAENQLAKSVSADAARCLLEHLETRTFYVGRIDEFDPKPALPELRKLLNHIGSAQPPVFEPVAFPQYSIDNLVLAIQEAARDFRQQWQGMLGLAPHPDYTPRHWQTIKALSRRYAEGWDDGFVLRPTSNLVAALAGAVSRFLETPVGWSGNPTLDQKRETIDSIKSAVVEKFPDLSAHRLREQSRPAWQDAYALRGAGSTLERRMRIEGIYERRVPVPDARGDRLVIEFMDEIKKVVIAAVEQVEAKVTAIRVPATTTVGG